MIVKVVRLNYENKTKKLTKKYRRKQRPTKQTAIDVSIIHKKCTLIFLFYKKLVYKKLWLRWLKN